MTFQERLLKLDRLHHLIRRRGTGTPAELASRLGVCKRTVHNLIDELRNLGAPIAYSYTDLSYYYKQEIELQLTPVLKSEFTNLLKGGRNPFFYWDAGILH